jgi:hypothetical protein
VNFIATEFIDRETLRQHNRFRRDLTPESGHLIG